MKNTNMKKEIEAALQDLERAHRIRILFAIESGSRAWGFASEDSDYDVRFVYVHPVDRYLSIDRGAEYIDGPQNKVLDITGMELRKAAQLFRKSNAVIYEWLQSPVWYRREEAFVEDLWQLAPQYFSARAAIHHYLGLARKTMGSDLQGDAVRLKKYFYALRPVLAARWIALQGGPPPMEFGPLRTTVDDKAVQERMEALLEQKARVDESFLVAPDPVLQRFIEMQMQYAADCATQLEKSAADVAPLDELFRKTIKRYGYTNPA